MPVYMLPRTSMNRRILLPVAALFLLTLPTAHADLQADYTQVRKIALKDRGVRAAYAKADAKLDAKILEIDPSLKPIVENRGVAPKAAAKRPAAKKPLQGAPSSPSAYVVAKGDTLTNIAARYGVTAADLKSANGIVDERKLQVGQKLTIPNRPTASQPTGTNADGLWTRLKHGR